MSNTEKTKVSKSNDNTQSTLPLAETPVAIPTDTNAAPKAQRIGVKQRRTDFTEYKETYFAPVSINKDNRRAINITKETWALLERYSRILGDGAATIGGYADRIIADHFAACLDDLEAWRKL